MVQRAKNFEDIFTIIREDIQEYIDEVDDELAELVVKETVKRIRSGVRKYVHNPTQWTLQGIQPALNGEYGVRVRNNVAAVLRNVTEGLPFTGAVPNLNAPEVNIDFHGNEPRGQFRRLSRRANTFTLRERVNGVEPGVYKRLGRGKMRRLYRFAKNEARRARLPYEKLANESLDTAFNDAAEAIIENLSFDDALIEKISYNFDFEIPKAR